MKKINYLKVIIVLYVLFLTGSALAQSTQDIAQWLVQLQSQDWQVRQKAAFALNRLPYERQTDTLKEALIMEFEREYTKISKGDFEKCVDCEDGGEEGYYSWLFETVAKMKDDRAFPLFVRIGSPAALSEYGDKGIAVILDSLDYKNYGKLSAAITVLKDTLKQDRIGYSLKGITKERIKQAMLTALKENSHPEKRGEGDEVRAREHGLLRSEVVKALGSLAEAGDTEVIPILKSLSEEDPYFLDMSKKKNYSGPQKKYIVREEAQKVLEQIKGPK